MELNEDQLAGIEKIKAWYRAYLTKKTQQQLFFLTGSAGTGKTSLAMRATIECVMTMNRAVFIAPTGKAASRLRQKGCSGAKTLHQFIYNVQGEDEDGKLQFTDKGVLDNRPALVVLDEASMVNAKDMERLLYHRIPVLALGDLKQLEPVSGSPYLTANKVNYELKQIMRQAAESNIVRASIFASQGTSLPLREYDDVQIRAGEAPLEQLVEHSGEDAQILCSYNSTRTQVNDAVRQALGFTGKQPQVGEKVMCWFNQHGSNFMNGEQGIVLGFEEMPQYVAQEEQFDLMYIRVRSLTDGRERRLKFNPLSFSDNENESKVALKNVGGFQFGYAATIHKSQGSEWKRILLLEERMGDFAKMNYTAYTRAIENLRIYKNR